MDDTPRKPSPGQPPEPLLPKHGGYRNLKGFQVAQLVYDVIARFQFQWLS